ncbi:NYN domain-containing protein [Streptomyces sp. NPDC001107]
MTVPGVIIDASNVAATRTRRWPFSRVVEVRDAWLRDHPGAGAIAVLDASVRRFLDDQHLLQQAERAQWLEVRRGDADDRILALAVKFNAGIVSGDKFRYARREHPWLQGNDSRVWGVSWVGGRVVFVPRRLGVATDEEIERDREKKRSKAGLLPEDAEVRFRCTSSPDACLRGGEVLLPRHVNKDRDRWYCRSCSCEAVEILVEPPLPDDLGTGPVQVTVRHGFTVRRILTVPAEGLALGRASRRHPEVTDVTDGLTRDDADTISRLHVRIYLDDDGNPLVEHVPEKHRNVTFLNPELDFDGRPRSGRLATGPAYGLEEGDELFLGPGLVRLRIGFGRDT